MMNLGGTVRTSGTVFPDTRRRSRSVLTAAWIGILLCMHPRSHPQLGEEICELVVTGCPENFNGDTIDVPEAVNYLSAGIRACDFRELGEGVRAHGGSPSIVFVIDHTGSMMGISTSDSYPHDRMGSRFTVTKQLLDTIYARWDSAEVALVVFREHLYFDPTSDEYYAKYFQRFDEEIDEEPDQAFLPFMNLHREYDGREGIDIIKDILAVDTSLGDPSASIRNPPDPYEFVDLKYEPNFSANVTTNINGAFEAVRQILPGAANPVENQFMVFLSDGEPRGGSQAGKPALDFVEGVGMPTTFTVFFTSDREGPESINQMTENIRANGFSFSNRYSDVWALEASHESLLELLMGKVVQTVLTVTLGTPYRFSVNDSTATTTVSDSFFIFDGGFPIAGELTHFNFDITYRKRDVTTGEQRDTTHAIDFHVRRIGAAVPPEGTEVNCWYGRGIQLLHEGKQVDQVFNFMDTLEVRVSTGDTATDECEVEVTNHAGDEDREELDLERREKWWSGSFPRAVDTSPDRNDGVLQHGPRDSIIVTWENPDNPDDILRVSVPFNAGEIVAVHSAAYFDRDADGLIDSVWVGIDGDFEAGDIAAIAAQLTLPPHREFTVAGAEAAGGGGIGLLVTEGSSTPFTGVTAEDKLTIEEAPISSGTWLNGGTVGIDDKVAPVILSARLSLGPIEGEDTLSIRFSETVNRVTNSTPLSFAVPGGERYTMVLAPEGTGGMEADFLVREIRGVERASKGDSVWIDPSALVGDIGDNVQRNPLNRRALLELTTGPVSFTPHAANNPFVPGRSPVPPFIRAIVSEGETRTHEGVVIMVESRGLTVRTERPSATLSIYDVVKNPVVLNRPMALEDPPPSHLPSGTARHFFVWDGTNRNGRRVGGGTYLAVITIDGGDVSERMTLRIGVKEN